MNDPKKLILISVIVFVVFIILTIIVLKKYKKKMMFKKIKNLDIIKNEILSLPLQLEIDKIHNLTKGEQIEEKANHYQDMYDHLKKDSFQKIDDKIDELEFVVNSPRKKEFVDRYMEIELELVRNRYFINHMISELKELTSFEDKYRGIVIKLKTKYRNITREYENNKDLYGLLTDTIEMQFENIEKRFNDFELVVEENLYNEVILVVRSLEGMIDHLNAIVTEIPDILVLLNDLIPSRVKELEASRKEMLADGYTLTFMNLDYNLKEIEKIENDIVDRSKVLNVDNSLLELKTILEFIDSLFKDMEKEKKYKKDFLSTVDSFHERINNVKKTLNDVNNQLDDIKGIYGLKDEDLKDLVDISVEYDELAKKFRSLIRKVKKEEESYGKMNLKLNELGIALKKLEDRLDITLKGLGSMKDDEERARDQLEEVQELLKSCKRQIQSAKIPVVANNYFVELSEANEAILEIIKELEKKPIAIKTLNTRVDTARDLVFKLNNTTKSIVNNAYFVEQLIVYANRYRGASSEVQKSLNRAEVLFYKGSYESAMKLIVDMLDKFEPGFKVNFNKVVS